MTRGTGMRNASDVMSQPICAMLYTPRSATLMVGALAAEPIEDDFWHRQQQQLLRWRRSSRNWTLGAKDGNLVFNPIALPIIYHSCRAVVGGSLLTM